MGWHGPAAVLGIIAVLQSAPKTIGEAAAREALRRAVTPRSSTVVGNADIRRFERPVPQPMPMTPPVAASQATGAAGEKPPEKPEKPDKPVEDEAWWRDRMDTARKALVRDELLADALQSRINALTTDWVNRDDPAQKAQLGAERTRTIAELDRVKKQIEADRQGIVDIEEDARKKGIPPGWIR